MEQPLAGTLAKILAFNRDSLPQLDLEFKEEAKIIEGMPFSEYCSDRTRINASSLKHILETPAHFLSAWNHGLEEDGEEEPDHFKIGRAVHLAVLEPELFRELYVVQPEFVGLTKDGRPTTNPNALDVKKQKEEWLAKQKPDALILTSDELGCLTAMIESILANDVAANLLRVGLREVVLQWTDVVTGVKCKGRVDILSTLNVGGETQIHLIDLKTSRNLKKGIFTREADRLLYHVSMAFYADGILEIYKRLPSTISIFAVEKKRPFASRVLVMTDEWYEDGQQMYRDALELYKQCLETGKWPAYSNQAEVMDRPSYLRTYTKKEYDF